MSVHDRDYIRDLDGRTGPRYLFSHLSAVGWLLIANGAVFVAWLILGPRGTFMVSHFTASLDGVVAHLRLYTLVSSAFSHAGLWHLAFNMLFLVWFGRELETIYGPRDLIFLYLLCGTVASAAHLATCLYQGYDAPVLGASGSVMGVMAACACLFPDRPVNLWGLLTIPLKWLAIGYVALDVLSVAGGQMTGIANMAHLGGAAAGYLFHRLDLRIFGTDWNPRGVGRLLLRLWREGRTGRSAQPGPVAPEIARRVDDLLSKISREGMAGLTEEERRFLDDASRRYRR